MFGSGVGIGKEIILSSMSQILLALKGARSAFAGVVAGTADQLSVGQRVETAAYRAIASTQLVSASAGSFNRNILPRAFYIRTFLNAILNYLGY